MGDLTLFGGTAPVSESNIVLNGGMEIWTGGTTFTNPANGSALADKWTIVTDQSYTFTVSRDTTNVDAGGYSMKLAMTAALAGTSLYINQSVDNYKEFMGRTIGYSFRIKSNAPVLIFVDDGVTKTYSTIHPGDGSWKTLTLVKSVSSVAAYLYLSAGFYSVAGGPAPQISTIYFDGAFCSIGNSPLIYTPRPTALENLITQYPNFVSALYLALTGGTMSGPIAMGTQKITGLSAGTVNGDALRYEQLVGLYLLLTGGTMSGAIAMGSNKVTGLAAGTTNGDALRYEQLVGLYLLLTGGTMSGAIAMGSNKITGLANGTAATDAAAFGQIPKITSWASYTPTFVGLGTVTNIQMYWRQVNDTLEIMGSWTSGTTTNVQPVFSIPSSITMAVGSNLTIIGVWSLDSTGSVNSTNNLMGVNAATNVQFARSGGAGASPLAVLTTNGAMVDNVKYSVKLSVVASNFP